MKRFLIICTAATLWLVSSLASAASIVGTAHDFSNVGSYNEICVFCHTPHDSVASSDGPLWNRGSYTPTGFTMYPSGGTIQGTVSAAPDGTSVLCLSCHDGTLAIDSFGGGGNGGIAGAGTAGDITSIDPTAQVDTDMTNDHPISITYRDDLDGELRAKTYSTWSYGNGTSPANGTSDLLDTGDKVQCTSCHDVHATLAGTDSPNYLLKIDNSGTAGSDLCLACHAK